jgi:hypothetical protein
VQDIENSLRIVHRDVRVTRNGIRPARQRAALGIAGALARAIGARYTARSRWAGPAGLIFRRPQPGLTIQQVRHEAHAHFSPRLALTLLAWSPPPVLAAVREAGTGLQMPVSRLERRLEMHLLQRSVIERTETERSERFTRRFVERGERVESVRQRPGTAALPVTRADAPAASLAQPAPRLLYRPPSAATVSEAGQAPVAFPRDAAPRQPLPAQRASLAPELAPADINRLTDQVIQAIDHRIIAQRERLGRV